MTNRYDLIIIGSGAGGGTLAHRLAPTGKRILLLERGDYLPRERENWDPTAVFVQSKYKAKETWYGSDGRALTSSQPDWGRCSVKRLALAPTRAGAKTQS